MRRVYCRKVVLMAIVLLTILNQAQGQLSTRGSDNFRDFQQKPYYFGLTFGFNSSNFQLHLADDFILNDSFAIAEPVPGPGFNVSIVTNLKLGDYFDLRFMPGFSFAERSIAFSNIGEEQSITTKTIESVLVQAPFHVRYKSAPYKDKRVFVVAGIKYTYDVASNSRIRKEQSDNLIKISPHDYAFEVGAGIQFFLPYFIFSPEIKYSQSLGNSLIYNGALEQSRVIGKVLSRTFTISIHLEG